MTKQELIFAIQKLKAPSIKASLKAAFDMGKININVTGKGGLSKGDNKVEVIFKELMWAVYEDTAVHGKVILYEALVEIVEGVCTGKRVYNKESILSMWQLIDLLPEAEKSYIEVETIIMGILISSYNFKESCLEDYGLLLLDH